MAALRILFRVAAAPFTLSHPILFLAALAYPLYMVIRNLLPSRPITPGIQRDDPEHSDSASPPPSPPHWSSTSAEYDSEFESTAPSPPSLTSSQSTAASYSEPDTDLDSDPAPPCHTHSQIPAASDSESDSQLSPPYPTHLDIPAASDSERDSEPAPARPPSQPQPPSFSTAEPSLPVSATELILRKLARRQQVLAMQAAIAAARKEGLLGRQETKKMLRSQSRENTLEREKGRKAKAAREWRWE